jgi:hypothetical protein
MRSRGLQRLGRGLALPLALAGLLLAAPLARADDRAPTDRGPEPPTNFAPAALLRIEGLDNLLADLRYLFKEAGQKDVADQLEGGLKLVTGPKGLEGFDTKKPIGVYVSVASKLNQSQVILLLPIADQKKFLAFLEERDFKAEKGADDVYTLTVEPIPVPILFRFAHGYLYATPRLSKESKLPGKDRLPRPAGLLTGSGLLSLTANLDRIPNQVRKLAISVMALQLGNLKDDKLEGETDAQQEVRGAVLDEVSAQVKSILEDGGPMEFRLGVDRKKHELALSFRLTGRPNTTLAKNIAALAQVKSLGAAVVGRDSALGGFLNLALPAEVVKKLGPAVDEAFKKGLDRLGKDDREALAPLVKAMEATAKSGRLDFAVDFRGPDKSGKYTVVACGAVQDGDKIEAAFRKAVDKQPQEKRRPIKLDDAKVAGVSIHRVEHKDADARTRALLGDGPLYFAVRKDAVVLSVGEDALAALKSALALEPKAAAPMRLEGSLARMAALAGRLQKGAEDAAKQAFKEKGSDRVSLVVKAGKTLEVKLSVKTAVLTFAGLLDKARQDEQ